jgi:hypothetical protein
MMWVTVVVEVRSNEGTKCILDSSVNLSLGLVRAGLGLDNVLREYPYLKGEDVMSLSVSVVVVARIGLRGPGIRWRSSLF